MPKERATQLGTKSNRTQSVTLRRKDTQQRRSKIDEARRLIYEQGFQVKSVGVERLLGPQSLVPIHVRILGDLVEQI